MRRVIGLAGLALATMLATASLGAQTVGGRSQPAAPAPRDAAPFDLTGYWVSIVTEDWRYRMVTPTLGDYQSLPLTPAAARLADRWDPAADERAGLQCKSYGAPALMRVPGRLHVSWRDAATLLIEMDAGTQTRVLHFGAFAHRPERTWQGESSAAWELPARAAAPPPVAPPGSPRPGSLRVRTTQLRAGYLRKNGVPYSEDAVLTEYFDVARLRDGTLLLVVTSTLEDPVNLTQPFIVSTQFRRQPDASGWMPTPCSSTW